MNQALKKQCEINQGFYRFINEEVLPHTQLNSAKFWQDFTELVEELAPENRELLRTRQQLQDQIDQWHQANPNADADRYEAFLRSINYLVDEPAPFAISTQHVDEEIATIAGPQLVVPVMNARFALNAANARWGSLYDALYGTDAIPSTSGLAPGRKYNPARGKHVIDFAKDFLDQVFPLEKGSHHDVASYTVYFQHLLAYFPDGSESGLVTPCQFVAFANSKADPSSIVLKNNGLHIELMIDRNGFIGQHDLSGIDDIKVEAALSTIMDLEDSIAAVDAQDKITAYRNWMGLIQGNLTATFEKGGALMERHLNPDKIFNCKDGEEYRLHGRSLLLVRNVGHLMDTELMQDAQGNFAPEGIVDAVVTSLIAMYDLAHMNDTDMSKRDIHNSRRGSIYIVKPKMHGPAEVAFTCKLFSRVEDMLGLTRNTIKLGIMDEERRTTVNLKACIYEARERVFFINTGFLDRTGDEIHTSMEAGAFLPKNEIKQQVWIQAYEDANVDAGLSCGFVGKAQIGKGMWAMPDEMAAMMKAKIDHPKAGASTAWVPSPTAAVLHALHYHQVDVHQVQQTLAKRTPAALKDVLTQPLLPTHRTLTANEIEQELANNIQGILGYVVRWVEMGVGCSKVPDINNIGLMEDRATLRISSQHLANWLKHGICSTEQVLDVMATMAAKVDQQNAGVKGYRPMTPDLDNSLAFQSAKALIFEGGNQPSGYTEPLLHQYRRLAKQAG
ncbi:malate synthase G [Motilimonas eburnea]|uniref:malate synthase G n=1 Tax=Motilimonas eburnea TaxID=1737488 RepID=UPI001E63F815|nr:malate synthase G [Motilimonas eburnea]MCE2570184.1 malate synthase G [Motilimonas eburnea]